MRHRLAQHRLCLVDIVGDAGANAVADKEIRVATLRRRQSAQRFGHMCTAAIGEDETLGDLCRERDHPLAQRGEDDRWQRTVIGVRLELLDKGANVAKGGTPIGRRTPPVPQRLSRLAYGATITSNTITITIEVFQYTVNSLAQ